jgi:hypothetical protein
MSSSRADHIKNHESLGSRQTWIRRSDKSPRAIIGIHRSSSLARCLLSGPEIPGPMWPWIWLETMRSGCLEDTQVSCRSISTARLPECWCRWCSSFRHVLTVSNPIGRGARKDVLAHSSPLIRNRKADLEKAGIRRVPRVRGVRDGVPVLEDGRMIDARNVMWCTGFTRQPAWIKVPVFGSDGEPDQHRGVVANRPGLYFLGREFLYALSSVMIQGIGRDAEYVARHIDARTRGASRSRPRQRVA